jgi:peptidoglycan/LPS O-acetylase OafA/YrhL
MQTRHGEHGYRPDLDGLRAVAVLLVLADHAEWPFPNNAGFGGVTAFFVLSGYLITTLLVREHASRGRVNLRAFYLRRGLRLLPALAVVSVFVVVVGAVGGWGPAPWQAGVLASSLYIGNWLPLFGVGLGPMTHTWSLAIEEQFYLVWPAVLLVAPRRWLPWAMALLVAFAVGQRALSDHGWNPATTAHMDGLILGCAAALWGWRLPGWAGSIAIALLVSLSLFTFAYTIEFATICALIVVLSAPGSLVPLAPLGRRAYGIYLWNGALTMLVGPLAAPLSILAAEGSYRFVEQPALRLKARVSATAADRAREIATQVAPST